MFWLNKDNQAFYEHNLETLQTWSSAGGLNSCPDLIAIQGYIESSEDILEIGAGFGRVVRFLHEHYPQKHITALERSTSFCNMLKKDCDTSINIIHADLMDFQPQKKHDLILWLWSGLTDFSKEEQLAALKHVVSLLMQQKGRLIIETFPHDAVPSNGKITKEQQYLLTANDYSLHGYIPSPEEMADYAHALDVMIEKTIYYIAGNGRKRVLYVLTTQTP